MKLVEPIRLAFALLLVSISTRASAATRTIDKDATWAGDTLVDDDVTVRPGVTLTVDRASVKFARRATLLVHGRLVAKDSTFTSAEAKPSPGDWRGVEISPQPAAFLPPGQSKSSVERCTIEYARAAITVVGGGAGGGDRGMAPPVIRKNVVRRCSWAGIAASNLKDVEIEDNTISEICLAGPSDQGRAISLTDCAKARVAGNTIHDVSDTAIFFERCADGVIDKNTTDKVVGGPGPGPGGYYKDWAFAVVLLDSDRNRVVNNTFTHTGYHGVVVAYGSDDNVVESNTIQWCLAAINVLGDGKNNAFRRNKVNGGWTVLYHNGPGPTTFEKCDIDGGGGACFTVRTGQAVFRDCVWKNTNGMNAWGGDVTVERCKLAGVNGPTLSLQNDAKIKLVECEMDWSKVQRDAKFTGRMQRVPEK